MQCTDAGLLSMDAKKVKVRAERCPESCPRRRDGAKQTPGACRKQVQRKREASGRFPQHLRCVGTNGESVEHETNRPSPHQPRRVEGMLDN